MRTLIHRFFRIDESGTSIGIETSAGITTYLTMVYIVFVQPAILSQAGMDHGAVMMATCLSAAFASILMGLLANYPIGLAPGMGENFFFVFTVVIGMGVSWEAALACVFISGVIFIILSLVRIREMIIDAIPPSMKAAIAGGIGLFVAFIGLVQGGIIARPPTGIVALGDLHTAPAVLTVIGLLVISILMCFKIRGAILIGMLITLVAAFIAGVVKYSGIASLPPSIAPTFFKLDFAALIEWNMITVIVIFLFMDMFDTTGTLIGVSQQAGLLKNGKLPRASRALLADAFGTTFGAVVGTSTVTSYVESVAGVQSGGRTGLTAVVVGILFLLTMFFYPLTKMIGAGVPIDNGTLLYPITAPALIVVGSLMLRSVRNIDWDNIAESVPAFLILIGIPLTYSVADGLAFGFVSYPILMLFAGKGRKVAPLAYVLCALFLARFIFL
jgi:AGZA family xanthine/uracil permease-like MFS transporter